MTRTAQPPKQLARLSVTDLQRALPKLQRRIDEINAIDPLQATRTYTPEFSAIIDSANATLMEIFGPTSIEYERYKVLSIYAGRSSLSREVSRANIVVGYSEGKKRALIKLDAVIKFVNEKLADSQTMAEQSSNEEEWLRAAAALSLLGMSHNLGARTICKRAHAGLIEARAERFTRDRSSADNVKIPVEFWWAQGEAALIQNWKTGDFDTWINDGGVHLEAFGVTFRRSDIERAKPAAEERQQMTSVGEKVFIGHGRSPVWRELSDFLEKRVHLSVDEFNSVSVAGVPTATRLEEMLKAAAFAFLVMTAEDELPDGKRQARLNVVHEAGLFQGKLGFQKAIVLLEEGCEDFSNIHGLNHIPFPKGNISTTFEKIRGVLEREGLLAASGPAPFSEPLERKGGRLRYTHPRGKKE